MRLFKGPHPKEVAGARLLKVDVKAGSECLRVKADMLLSPEDVRTFHHQGLFEWQPTIAYTDLGLIRRNRQRLVDSIKDDFRAYDLMAYLNDRSDSDSYVRGYQSSAGPRVWWNKRGRFWTFCEFVETNPATLGLIQMLDDLVLRPQSDQHIAGQQLGRILTALDTFWN